MKVPGVENQSQYQVGGSLPSDAPSYVQREADNLLYQSLRDRNFCYVFNSRQMGKSSLRVRTMQRLQANGDTVCGFIDLTEMGSAGLTKEQWYAGIIRTLVSSFELLETFKWREWWKERQNLSIVNRLKNFIEEVLLTLIDKSRIVIFIDEIDSILSLNFSTDDLFSLILFCYNKRAENKNSPYSRLDFVLLGTATPYDLIKKYNWQMQVILDIGIAVNLQGFILAESDSLITGLSLKACRPKEVLKEVLKWTAGQPFLTQKVCKIIHNQDLMIPAGKEATIVEKLVRSQIIQDWEYHDVPEHLKTVRDRILQSGSELLKIYYILLQEGELKANDGNQDHLKLRLSGLVVKKKGNLQVANRIYQSIFDRQWVLKELNKLKTPPPILFPRWMTAIAVSIVVTTVIVGIRFTGALQWMELPALDKLMQLRPPEPIDPRILVVAITEEDVVRNGDSEISISDKTVGEVIEKLEKYQPKVIGLNVFRDIPIREGAAGKLEHEKLLEILKKNNILAACNISGINIPDSSNLPAPPGVLPQNLGFTNFTFDRDQIMRSQILQQDRSKDCRTELSLSWQLIRKYLATKNIATPEKLLENGSFQIGNLTINPLQAHTGGYQISDPDDYLGYQILLNYRSSQQPDPPFIQVTATELLQEPINSKLSQLIKNRVVLIGYTAQWKGDLHLTPYSTAEPYLRMPGVFIHAHMVSQILSAVEDGRPLLIAFSGWKDALWIFVYPLIAGLTFAVFKSFLVRSIIISSISFIIWSSSFLALLYWGIWLPLVPSLLSVATLIGSLELGFVISRTISYNLYIKKTYNLYTRNIKTYYLPRIALLLLIVMNLFVWGLLVISFFQEEKNLTLIKNPTLITDGSGSSGIGNSFSGGPSFSNKPPRQRAAGSR